MKFTEMGLNPEILEAITELGFENPTPIQEKIIPHLMVDNLTPEQRKKSMKANKSKNTSKSSI